MAVRVRFGSFVLDSGSRELRNLDRGVPVHLSPKAFDLLEVLVARRPNVVSKDVLLREIWGAKVVEEANLAIAVGEIRKALGDDPKSPATVVTVPRHGYRFAADAHDLDIPSTPAGREGVRCWLMWKDATLPLRDGDNAVGRHPASAVWLNAGSVSRTHARIFATPSGMMVEDRGSRNGTFVDGRKISAPHLLVDGSTVTFGSEATVFREWSDAAAVGTEPVARPQK
jgi:DNA-binding winged helix-turn-helix (wHTH) protein